jgi:hypothetical protein
LKNKKIKKKEKGVVMNALISTVKLAKLLDYLVYHSQQYIEG